jgi:serine/threonine protein kinase
MKDADRYHQAEQLFFAALERAPDERAAFLAEACQNDPELLAEVEALLALDEQSRGFIAAPAYTALAASLTQDSSPSLTGQRLGAYRLLDKLGAGGMGEVYLAEDTRLRRRVAVKLLPPEFTNDAERVRRFEREARAASALNHPNIITIHEIGQTEQFHFIVTEYVEGQTLRQRLAGGRMKLDEALEAAIQMATALQAAHEAGIVHRDIKPENVMLRRDNIVKVLDFGQAKLTERRAVASDPDASTSVSVKTDPGVVMGTARYMSPEQARGQEVDARTDIFSLGVVLYEMIAGQAPFTGETTSDVIVAILTSEPPPLTRTAPGVPADLQRIVSRALRKDREERYQNAADLLLDLKQVKQKIEVKQRSRTSAMFGRIKRRKRAAALALVAVIALAAAVFAYFRYFSRPTALTEKDTILLADWVNTTGEPIFDDTLRQALAVHLGQSPFLNLLSDQQARETLRIEKERKMRSERGVETAEPVH